MRKVSLIYTYGLKNSGDMAINLGAFDILLELNCEVKAFSRFDENDEEFLISKNYIKEYYPQVKFYGGPFKLNRDGNKIATLIDYLQGYLKTIGINEDKLFLEKLMSSQVVLFNGGNLFRSESIVDYIRLKALMYPLMKVREKKVPFIVLPQSASMINNSGYRLLNKILVQARQVFTREDKTHNYLNERFNNLKLEKSIDLAFFIKDNKDAENKFKYKYNDLFSSKTKKIAITLRTQVVGDLRELNNEKRNSIIGAINSTIEQFINFGNYEIILIVQTRKDKEVTEQVYSAFKETNKVTIIEEYDTLVLREIYRKCELLIGMRLHSIILALSANTPAIGYFEKSWGFKNPGLMDKFNLPYKFVENEVPNLIKESNATINKLTSHKSNIKDIIEKERVLIKQSLENIIK